MLISWLIQYQKLDWDITVDWNKNFILSYFVFKPTLICVFSFAQLWGQAFYFTILVWFDLGPLPRDAQVLILLCSQRSLLAVLWCRVSNLSLQHAKQGSLPTEISNSLQIRFLMCIYAYYSQNCWLSLHLLKHFYSNTSVIILYLQCCYGTAASRVPWSWSSLSQSPFFPLICLVSLNMFGYCWPHFTVPFLMLCSSWSISAITVKLIQHVY